MQIFFGAWLVKSYKSHELTLRHLNITLSGIRIQLRAHKRRIASLQPKICSNLFKVACSHTDIFVFTMQKDLRSAHPNCFYSFSKNANFGLFFFGKIMCSNYIVLYVVFGTLSVFFWLYAVVLLDLSMSKRERE